jgi:peptide/nickel transport system permease protein
MANFVLKRLLQAIPVLFFVSASVFFVMRLSPGDPVVAMYGGQPGVTREMMDAARTRLGLDQPPHLQYIGWLSGILRGDLGDSYINHLPVSTILLQRLPATLELAVASILLAVVFAIPTGILAAMRRGGVLDHVVTAFVTAGIALPDFWLGILMVIFFAVTLGWLPSSGYVELERDPLANLRFLLLPAFTLAIKLAAPIMRFLRSAMLDVMGQDYIRVARAKGLSERRVVSRHALKNALIPAVTVVGLQFGALLGGAVMVEWIFGWPGIGWQIVQSINTRDYWIVLSGVLVVASAFVLANLLVDILYAFLDPRISRA